MNRPVVSKSVAALLSCNTEQNRFGYKPTSIFLTHRAKYVRAGLKDPKVVTRLLLCKARDSVSDLRCVAVWDEANSGEIMTIVEVADRSAVTAKSLGRYCWNDAGKMSDSWLPEVTVLL